MNPIELAAVRHEYLTRSLDEADVASDPIIQFDSWFAEAVHARLPMSNAMTLATADAGGRPSARIVLLKGADASGFVFFTDYDSRKGRELAENPRASLLFYWVELEREVRIEGSVVKTTQEESDTYFESRPLGSRLAAITSRQSSVLADRAMLEGAYENVARQQGAAPGRPPTWGGYRVVPVAFEFWQGRANRLHDRLLYQREGATWKIMRLAP